MKEILVFLSLLISTPLISQTKLELPTPLEVSIKKGDATGVAKFFNENIELSITNDDNIYSARQAEFVLQKFFRQNKPIEFTIDHHGGKNNTSYIIGNLETNNNNYKMILLLHKKNSTIKIHQLRINNE